MVAKYSGVNKAILKKMLNAILSYLVYPTTKRLALQIQISADNSMKHLSNPHQEQASTLQANCPQ